MRNYKIKNLFRCGEDLTDYMILLQNISPSKKLVDVSPRDIYQLTFEEVFDLRKLIGDNLTMDTIEKLITLVYPISDVRNIRTLDIFKSISYITDEIKQLLDYEKEMLRERGSKSISNNDSFRRYGPLNIVIPLAKTYNKTPDEVGKWAYTTVITLTSFELDVQHEQIKKLNENSKRNI